MEERIRPTRSGLFAIELLIAVGVFLFCAAICIGLFVRAEVISRDSADLTRAVSEAKNVAECWKAAGGDLEKTAELCGGRAEVDWRLDINYDEAWEQIDTVLVADAVFWLQLIPRAEDGYQSAELKVIKPGDPSEILLSWEIAALPEAAS